MDSLSPSRRACPAMIPASQADLRATTPDIACCAPDSRNRSRPVTTRPPTKSKPPIHGLNTAVSTSVSDAISRVNTSTPDPFPAFPQNPVHQESGMSCPQRYVIISGITVLPTYCLKNRQRIFCYAAIVNAPEPIFSTLPRKLT